jgi:hypothetical protein
VAHNEALAERVRRALAGKKAVGETRMFGGLCFTLRGNMCCGTLKEDLVVRVGPGRYEKALAEPHARPMDFTGRPLKGFVFVGRKGYKTDAALAKWVRWAVDFAGSLPEKKKRGSRRFA